MKFFDKSLVICFKVKQALRRGEAEEAKVIALFSFFLKCVIFLLLKCEIQ